ncbi:TPA: hypothetical protein ACPT3I_000425 [Klebsiella pneumoniae]
MRDEFDEVETIDRNPKSWVAWKREAERLQGIIDGMALAAMDSEPVAYMYDGEDGTEYNGHNEFSGGGKGIALYRHAQQPVVPDESYQQLSELYHAQEKRLFKIAQRIKGPAFDKYSHSPSQAIDVLEVAIFGDDESCRAAMLAAAPQENN